MDSRLPIGEEYPAVGLVRAFQVSARSGSCCRVRKWPLLVTILVIVSGFAYMFGWDPIVRHRS